MAKLRCITTHLACLVCIETIFPFLPVSSHLLPLPLPQAVDILHPWTLDPVTGAELAPFTTFSIAMIHRQSRGQLPLFVAGLERFKALKVGG